MKSLTGNSPSARGWALLLILFLGAGLFVAACGEEDVPAPTTPPPAPTPEPTPPPPEPEPEAPAVPTGLHVDAATANSITWHWTAVEGAVGYVVQASMDETWDATDTVTFNGAPFTTETEYTRSDLEPETTVYVRVAAAAGTVENHAVSAFSTHVTGMTMADTPPGPPVPANLRVTGQTSNSITWEWNAVEGATGYQSQFSGTSTFPTGSTGREFSTNTTRTVSNLDAEADGYLRVRAYTGTQAEPVFGMWTEGEMGTTAEPPPAAPLSAPTGLDADASNTSITLTWDSVRNAGSYEVQQRLPPDGNWGDADCGGDGNEVEDEECVVSGLASGTDYDFRVRAVPSDTDRYETSAWSDPEETRTTGTAPRPPPPPTSGGMGDLNVEWESTATTITFLWDRVTGGEYETAVLQPEDYSDDPEPCEGETFTSQGRSTSQVLTDAEVTTLDRGIVAGLCVRTKDEDDRRLSFAWGVATPVRPTAGTATVEDGRTTALPWTTINVVEDFNYAVHLVADSGRGDGMFSSGAAPTNAIQKACADGTRVDDGFADVSLTDLSQTVRSGIRHFTGYTLCLRYWNDAGTTSWEVPVDGSGFLNEIHATPATPPAPRLDSGTNNADGTARTLVWTVPVRNSADVPRGHGGFEAEVIHYPVRYDHDGDGGTTPLRSTPAPTAKTCGDAAARPSNIATGGSDPWTRVASTALGLITTLDGVQVTTTTALTIPDNTGENLGVRLCVRAIHDSAGTELTADPDVRGPWRIGSVITIPKQRP